MTAAVQKMMPSAVLASCVCSRKIWSTGKIEPHGGGRENLQAPASPSGYTCAREVHVPEIARPTHHVMTVPVRGKPGRQWGVREFTVL